MLRTCSVLSSFLCSAALGALLVMAPVAQAQAQAQTPATDTARATELFKNGKAAFAKGDMAEAERLFAQALEIRQSSDIAANLAQSELEQQKYRSAAQHFSWALANLLPSATDAQRKAVESGLAKARAEVAVLRLEIKPEGAEVLVGSQLVGKAPIAGGVFVDPGEVIVSVKREGFVAIDKRVMVGKGTEQAIEIELMAKEGAAPSPAEPALAVDSGLSPSSGATPPADRGERKSLVPAFVATGVAVAGGVTGLVLTLTASSKESDADDLRDRLNEQGGCNGGGAPAGDCADLKSDRESVDSSRNFAVGAFVVGGVAAIVAGYFYWDALSHRATAAAPRRPRLAVLPSVDVGRAAAAGSVQSVRLSVSGTF